MLKSAYLRKPKQNVYNKPYIATDTDYAGTYAVAPAARSMVYHSQRSPGPPHRAENEFLNQHQLPSIKTGRNSQDIPPDWALADQQHGFNRFGARHRSVGEIAKSYHQIHPASKLAQSPSRLPLIDEEDEDLFAQPSKPRGQAHDEQRN